MPPRTERRARPDYTPQVRARELRRDGRPRLSPDYPATSDVKRTYIGLSGGTLVQPLVDGTPGKRLRLIRVRVIQTSTDGKHALEVYFGSGASITTTPTKAVDVLNISDLGEDATRTYNPGDGPAGDAGDNLSCRFLVSPVTVHSAIVEYTLEKG